MYDLTQRPDKPPRMAKYSKRSRTVLLEFLRNRMAHMEFALIQTMRMLGTDNNIGLIRQADYWKHSVQITKWMISQVESQDATSKTSTRRNSGSSGRAVRDRCARLR